MQHIFNSLYVADNIIVTAIKECADWVVVTIHILSILNVKITFPYD